jgi:hypothetical protein
MKPAAQALLRAINGQLFVMAVSSYTSTQLYAYQGVPRHSSVAEDGPIREHGCYACIRVNQ